MTEQVPPVLQRFVAEQVVLLQTRKRDGNWRGVRRRSAADQP